MQSMVPSRSPSTTASRSGSARSGGFILVEVSYSVSRTAWSVSSRWCGVASAVTRTPRALPRRTASTAPAVEMCAMWTLPPVSSASSTSRSTITVSAAPGQPRSPSSVDTGPSFIGAFSVRLGSSQWSITVSANACAYSSARRMTRALATGRPSSETATQPASRRSPYSASSWPRDPRVMAPIG